jgi:outer membrane receptor protein involved in Fe transport
VTFRLDENMTFVGRYARGFTAGVVGQDTSEILDTYELGMRSRWFNDRLLVNLTGYYSTRDNIQVDVSVTDALGRNVRQRLNSAKGTIAGLDLDFQTSFRTRIGSVDFGGGVGLIDAKYTEFRSNVDRPVGRNAACTGPGLGACPLSGIAALVEDVTVTPAGSMPDASGEDRVPQSNEDVGVRPFGPFADNVNALFGTDNVRTNVDRTDLEFQNTPSLSYNLFVRYQLDMQRFGEMSASTSWYQQSKTAQNFFNTVEEGKYGVMDLSLSWSHPNRRLFVSAYMNNALDRRFIEGASDSPDFDGAESISFSRPRTYGIQVGYQFGGAR